MVLRTKSLFGSSVFQVFFSNVIIIITIIIIIAINTHLNHRKPIIHSKNNNKS